MGLFRASHVVHHQSEEFNLTTALRQPATGVFTAWIFYLPMALCGIPVPAASPETRAQCPPAPPLTAPLLSPLAVT